MSRLSAFVCGLIMVAAATVPAPASATTASAERVISAGSLGAFSPYQARALIAPGEFGYLAVLGLSAVNNGAFSEVQGRLLDSSGRPSGAQFHISMTHTRPGAGVVGAAWNPASKQWLVVWNVARRNPDEKYGLIIKSYEQAVSTTGQLIGTPRTFDGAASGITCGPADGTCILIYPDRLTEGATLVRLDQDGVPAMTSSGYFIPALRVHRKVKALVWNEQASQFLLVTQCGDEKYTGGFCARRLRSDGTPADPAGIRIDRGRQHDRLAPFQSVAVDPASGHYLLGWNESPYADGKCVYGCSYVQEFTSDLQPTGRAGTNSPIVVNHRDTRHPRQMAQVGLDSIGHRWVIFLRGSSGQAHRSNIYAWDLAIGGNVITMPGRLFSYRSKDELDDSPDIAPGVSPGTVLLSWSARTGESAPAFDRLISHSTQ